jgi:serine/threonine protein kinase
MSKRCIFCMEVLEEGQSTCPSCKKNQWEYQWNKRHLPPEVILHEKYQLGAVLGAGNFGITYLAFDTMLNQKVAIKEFFPGKIAVREDAGSNIQTADGQEEAFEKGKAGFKQEASLSFGDFDIPGICNVLDYFEENQTAYIVEEYLSGGTLKEWMENKSGHHLVLSGISEKPQSSFSKWEACRNLIVPVMEGLCHIHGQGIVHRDISPDNLMFDGQGNLKLIDFGAAEFIEIKEETVIAKEGYAPPEQYSSKDMVGPWTDIYGLCAVIYQMLSGEKVPPSMKRVQKDTLSPLSDYVEIQESVEQAILQGLALDIQKRYFYMGNLMEKLEMDTTHVQVLMGKIRSVWGEKWLQIVTEKNTDLENKRKRQLTGRQKKKLMAIVSCVTAGVLALGAGAYAYAASHQEEILKARVNRARQERSTDRDCQVINENSENYEELLQVIEPYKDESEYESIAYYTVPESVVAEHKLESNEYQKFYLDVNLAEKIIEHCYGQKLELTKKGYNGRISVEKTEKKNVLIWCTKQNLYQLSVNPGEEISVALYYDPVDQRVVRAGLSGNQEALYKFLEEVFPLIVPETYLTKEEIDGLFTQLEEDKTGSVSINTHAKFVLSLNYQNYDPETEIFELDLKSFSGSTAFISY